MFVGTSRGKEGVDLESTLHQMGGTSRREEDLHSEEGGNGKKGGQGAKEAPMPIAQAFQLYGEMLALKKEINAEAPKMPAMVLSKEHLESHAGVQNFLHDTEMALRYAYVVGPVIRTIIAVIEMIGALFTAAVLALQAALITPENDTDQAKIAASLQRDEMLANAQYSLTYAFHGVTNLVRAAFEATILGHIVLNASYDGEYRHEYDLVDRNRGDNYHTRLFSTNVREETYKDENIAHDRRYHPSRTTFSGVLASMNSDFDGQEFAVAYRDAYVARERFSERVKHFREELSTHAKEFSQAETLVRAAFRDFDQHEAAVKAHKAKIEKLDPKDQKGAAELHKAAPKALTREQQIAFAQVERFRDAERERIEEESEVLFPKAAYTLFPQQVVGSHEEASYHSQEEGDDMMA